jgi:hypothetical protein
MKRISIALIAVATLFVAAPAQAAPVKNGVKCVKQNQTTKVGRVTFTCTKFGSQLLWATKDWSPPYSAPNGSSSAYSYGYSMFLQTNSSTLYDYNYDIVFGGYSYASRSRAIYWCTNYFVDPDFFSDYYNMSYSERNQVILGCTDGVLRRDG